MKKTGLLSRWTVATLLGASLLAGCTNTSGGSPGATSSPGAPQPGISSTPSGSGSPEVQSTPTGPSTPGDVSLGDGASVDDAGGVSTEVHVWEEKFDGKSFTKGAKKVLLVPEASPLPGLIEGIKGMKKGGVRRIEKPAKDLFAELPPQMKIKPDQMFYIEVKVLDVYPKEPFEIKTTRPGTGDKAAAVGDLLKVHYTGRLEGFDSKNVFDSSRERNQPFVVKLGQGQVIPGWEKGLLGIKKGEQRRLSIPHYLAYGDNKQGEKIGPKSRLFFDVELVDFVTPGELVVKTTKPGNGAPIAAGQSGNFHYTGWLDGFNGKNKFDSSKDRKQTFKVKLGAGNVIAGWDQGLVGMKPGEVRLLEIPYNLGYGERGSQSIPPYATLFFEVEYVSPADGDEAANPKSPGQGNATPAAATTP